MALSFDELLNLAVRKGPHEFEIRALGGKKIYVREPSSADVDAWRMHCSRHQSGDAPLAAKLVQLLLCDEEGEQIVPQTAEALAKLADGDPKTIDEIAKHCLPLVNEPSEDDLENEKKV